MKKRIALISDHASPLASLGGVDNGGQNVYVGQLAKHLNLLGYRVDVFTRKDDPKLPDIVSWYKDVRIIHVPAGPARYVRKEELFPFMDEFTAYVKNFVNKYGSYKLIHANFWMSGIVASEIKKTLGIPFVITFHALGKIRRQYQKENDLFPDDRFEIEENLVDTADQVIAECPQDKEDLLNFYKANPNKITVIPCGFDPDEFYPVDKTFARIILGLPVKEKIVLHVGRIVPRKGVDTVIRSVGRLKAKYNLSVKLVIVGGDSGEPDIRLTPEIKRLKEIAVEEGVRDSVMFVGRKKRDILKFYYSAADIFVTTPWYETFGITPLEAMACAIPVVGSRVGGIKYTVADEKTGILVPPNDPDTLSGKLHGLFTRPRSLRDMGQRAFSQVSEKFTWMEITQKVSTLYENIISQNSYEEKENSLQLYSVDKNFDDIVNTFKAAKQILRIPIIDSVNVITAAIKRNKKILVCGNGGSAADASHFAGELVGRFKNHKRKGLPVIALNTDMSVITAWANDSSYETIFSRQVEALGQAGDILIGISTSGISQNLIEAFRKAKEKKLICIGLLGKSGGSLLELSDIAILVPSYDSQRIQEIHINIIHTVCELVEKQLMVNESEYILDGQQIRKPLARTNGKNTYITNSDSL
ncbi:MAG: Phosphoheptose isomerase [Candidatus Gottesmanbacteria bacterium GW2011_GWC2_39_8]|uniref:Phosphoheptose isomerase n=1 Tax=Candidatus Gottesmanbacteria bacterium GW2011_GWC2_39_8 TaxID=1618450 RepID=A0A0G0Q126_9BACT|nr:MAG: Phosphoheptose isomerase [Candidatus Gottesmanbacteria bacterium GW2011_GWC2_39_8]